MYLNSTPAPAWLAKGTANQYLRMNSGATDPEWNTPTYEMIAADILNSAESRTTTTTLADVTGWSISVEANKEYVVEITGYLAPGLGGWKFDFTGPSSPTAVQIVEEILWDGASPLFNVATAFSSAINHAITAASPFTIRLKLRNGANAGTVQFRFAQNTSSGTTTINAGAYFKAWRISN
jgi:hypothetical protein